MCVCLGKITPVFQGPRAAALLTLGSWKAAGTAAVLSLALVFPSGSYRRGEKKEKTP
jgi:hypothetical protein